MSDSLRSLKKKFTFKMFNAERVNQEKSPDFNLYGDVEPPAYPSFADIYSESLVKLVDNSLRSCLDQRHHDEQLRPIEGPFPDFCTWELTRFGGAFLDIHQSENALFEQNSMIGPLPDMPTSVYIAKEKMLLKYERYHGYQNAWFTHVSLDAEIEEFDAWYWKQTQIIQSKKTDRFMYERDQAEFMRLSSPVVAPKPELHMLIGSEGFWSTKYNVSDEYKKEKGQFEEHLNQPTFPCFEVWDNTLNETIFASYEYYLAVDQNSYRGVLGLDFVSWFENFRRVRNMTLVQKRYNSINKRYDKQRTQGVFPDEFNWCLDKIKSDFDRRKKIYEQNCAIYFYEYWVIAKELAENPNADVYLYPHQRATENTIKLMIQNDEPIKYRGNLNKCLRELDKQTLRELKNAKKASEKKAIEQEKGMTTIDKTVRVIDYEWFYDLINTV